MAKLKPVEVSADEYQDHDDSNDGICLACGEWTTGGCEPDARQYKCDSCEENAVYGAQEALIMGMIILTDE